MFLVIPEIAISDGKCEQTIMTSERNDSFYANMVLKPDELIQLFRRENAKSVVVNVKSDCVDSTVELLNKISECTEIPVQVIVNLFDKDIIASLIGSELLRVYIPYHVKSKALIDSFLVSDPFLVNKIVPIIALTDVSLVDSSHFSRVCLKLHDNQEWDHETLVQIDLPTQKVTLYGGINNHKGLKLAASFASKAIDSCIIGKPLFDNSFPCQSIWRKIEREVDTNETTASISKVLA